MVVGVEEKGEDGEDGDGEYGYDDAIDSVTVSIGSKVMMDSWWPG